MATSNSLIKKTNRSLPTFLFYILGVFVLTLIVIFILQYFYLVKKEIQLKIDLITATDFQFLKNLDYRIFLEHLSKQLPESYVRIKTAGFTFDYNNYSFASICSSKTVNIHNVTNSTLEIQGCKPLSIYDFLVSGSFFLIPFMLILIFYLLSKKDKIIFDFIKQTSPTYFSESKNIHSLSDFLFDIDKMTTDIFNLQKAVEKNKVDEKFNSLANQVAHDIRSPLAALNTISPQLNTSKEVTELFQNSLDRINRIANDILRNTSHYTYKDNIEVISKILINIVQEKKLQYKNITFNVNIAASSEKVTCFDSIEIGRVISNIINNSIEAMNEKGQVDIKLNLKNENENESVLTISDHGKGIPKDILPELTKKGVTFGKSNGTGLGLFHAKNTVEKLGGKLEIISTLEKGTTVVLTIPNAIDTGYCVLIDDDPIIRSSWKISAKVHSKNFYAFENIATFLQKIDNFPLTTIFYIDSDLKEIKGEVFAKELYNKGYTTIYLTTGYSKEDFSDMYWIKKVLGKTSPWDQIK